MGDVHVPRVVLVTGGCGFIGANYVRWLLHHDATVRVVNLDLLTYAGHEENVAGVEATGRYTFVRGDIADEALVKRVFAEYAPDTVVHFAAESHVDRSIDAPGAFLRTNVIGTFVLLQAARAAWAERKDVRFHAVSTDEVFGSLGEHGFFTESTPYDPSSPYSASKASADHLARAWHRTFGLPVTLSNCSNNYGPYQFPEKLVPLMILKALKRQALPVYGDGQNVRDWLYVVDHCEAIDTIVRRAATGSTYLVSGHNEWRNLDLVHALCDAVDARVQDGGPARRACVTFVKDRPGHDRRYAIDASRLKHELGWVPRFTFPDGLAATIAWYLDNGPWISAVTDGKYALERLGTA